MPSKGNINIVHDEQIWRDHIRTGILSDVMTGPEPGPETGPEQVRNFRILNS